MGRSSGFWFFVSVPHSSVCRFFFHCTFFAFLIFIIPWLFNLHFISMCIILQLLWLLCLLYSIYSKIFVFDFNFIFTVRAVFFQWVFPMLHIYMSRVILLLFDFIWLLCFYVVAVLLLCYYIIIFVTLLDYWKIRYVIYIVWIFSLSSSSSYYCYFVFLVTVIFSLINGTKRNLSRKPLENNKSILTK